MQLTTIRPETREPPISTFGMSTTVIDGISQIVLHGTIRQHDLERYFRHAHTLAGFTQGWVIDWSQSLIAISGKQLIASGQVARGPVAHILRIDQRLLFDHYFDVCAARGLRREHFLDADTALAWVHAVQLDRYERADL